MAGSAIVDVKTMGVMGDKAAQAGSPAEDNDSEEECRKCLLRMGRRAKASGLNPR